MNKKLQVLVFETEGYAIRTEELEGRKHLVVPVVMMVEGVHSGSMGPMLHRAEELGAHPASWNGIPVVVNHPEDADGNFISANSPNVLDRGLAGRVFESHMEDGALKAEAWLDLERLSRISPAALAYIRSGNPLEVSLGCFTDPSAEEGDFNGEHYDAIAHNHRPDHLALLPGGKGACSWEDGCGVRNQAVDVPCGCVTKKTLVDSLLHVNEDGLRKKLESLQRKLDSMDAGVLGARGSRVHFLVDAFEDNTVVYEVRVEGSESQLFRRDFSINTDGLVEFPNEPERVRRKVEFVSANSRKEVTVDKAKTVQGLIDNKAIQFVEADREFLEGLEDEQLQKLAPVEPTPQANVGGITREQAIEVLGEQLRDPKKFMELVPPEIAAQLRYGMDAYSDDRAKLITEVSGNTEVYTAEELSGLGMEQLRKLAKATTKEDFTGLGGGGGPTNHGEESPLLPPGVKEKKAE